MDEILPWLVSGTIKSLLVLLGDFCLRFLDLMGSWGNEVSKNIGFAAGLVSS